MLISFLKTGNPIFLWKCFDFIKQILLGRAEISISYTFSRSSSGRPACSFYSSFVAFSSISHTFTPAITPSRATFPTFAAALTNLVTGQEGERCLRTLDCGAGLCCARHFWTKICKPVLLEGQVCSRRGHKDTAQAPEIFQRCDCGPGLICRNQVTGNQQHTRLRVCQKI